MNKIPLKLEQEVIKILESLDSSLYSLTYEKQAKDNVLTILIDKEGGVDLDLCVKASELIGAKLDELDLISEEYMLEVASAGVERPLYNLEQYQKALNKFILVHTSKLYEGYDELVGYLKEVTKDYIKLEIKIKTRVKVLTIEFSDIIDALTTVNI